MPLTENEMCIRDSPIICIAARVLRAAVLNELKSDYVTYARARGFSTTEDNCLTILFSPPYCNFFFYKPLLLR